MGTGREIEETPAISLWAGRVGPLAPVHLARHPSGRRLVALRRLARPARLRPRPPSCSWPTPSPSRPSSSSTGWRRSDPASRSSGGTPRAGAGRAEAGWWSATGWSPRARPGSSSAPGWTIEPVVSQGCRAYGQPLTVTRSDRNVIYEVAGVPAMECMVDQIRTSLDPADIAGIESNGLLRGPAHRRARRTIPGPATSSSASVVGVDRSTGAVAVDDRVPLGQHRPLPSPGRPRPPTASWPRCSRGGGPRPP